jgi:hypothetical protein
LDHDPIDDEEKNQKRYQLDDERFINADHCYGADNLHGTRPRYFDVFDFVDMKRVRLIKNLNVTDQLPCRGGRLIVQGR